MKLDNPQKCTGLINQTNTAGVIICYPLNDLNYSRVSGQPQRSLNMSDMRNNRTRLGAERVSGLSF